MDNEKKVDLSVTDDSSLDSRENMEEHQGFLNPSAKEELCL